MALFKISKGEAANLAKNRPYASEGNAYFTTDDGKFYIDIAGDGSTTAAVVGTNRIPLNAAHSDTSGKLKTSVKINSTSFDGSADITTAQWGTARTISISSTAGTTGTSINGGADASLIIPDTMTGFKSITSTSFVGALTGNAATATALTTSAGSSTLPVYFSSGKPVACDTSLAVSITGNAATATTATNATNVNIADDTASQLYVLGATTTGNTRIYRETSVYMLSDVLHGACWNDYAEYRETKEEISAGRCVIETGKGDLILSTKRLQPGAELVSDTFGFAIGETEDCKTPIAATGRVLAYPNEDINSYKPGMPVCSGPNGTVSQMTEEEARMYPWCILGTVSEIPDYEEWGTGNIKVNGRIWIRIR